MSEFDYDYYERGVETGKSLYTNYRWIPELTIPLAATICEQLKIPEGASILDFGCAKGYLVKALRLLHRDAWGIDISKYAISQAPRDVVPYVRWGMRTWQPDRPDPTYEWGIAKDVLEHVEPAELDAVLADLSRACRKLFVIVPLGDNQGRWVIPAMAQDPTHRICEPWNWWADKLTGAGYDPVFWETKMKHIKEHWPDGGHGFFHCARSKT